jgi:uncharacterized membrane protein (UPF0127 family)
MAKDKKKIKNQSTGKIKKKPSLKRNNNKKKWLKIIAAIVILLAIVLLSIKPNLTNKQVKRPAKTSEIKFKKEGRLTFFTGDGNEAVRTIDLEIADGNYERQQGLMYRYSMGDTTGMLFIMEREEPQAFWMKNTYISLDIIYLNSDFRIVKIQSYTQPLSEESIPSYKAAKYVVEVIAGFCDRFGIEEGDYIRYELESQPEVN